MMTAPTSARLVRLRADGDRGFALLFVLFVTTVVMIGTATMLSVTTGGIKPSRQNQDAAAALSAAQAGLQRYLAALDANCPAVSTGSCSMLSPTAATTTITGVIGTQSFTASAVNPDRGSAGAGYLSANNAGTLYVTSTGTSPVSANGTPASGAITRTLTAALSGQPSPLRFAYFSDYETLGSALLNSYYGQRTIALTSPKVLAALGVSAASATANWNGAALNSPSNLGDNVCDKLWYDDPSNVNDGDTSTAGRYTLKTARSALPSGTDYAESGTLKPLLGTASPVTRYAPCETTFTNGENFNGPVYSRDAFYLSNGTSANASGPQFSVPTTESLPAAWTGWTTSSVPAAPNGTNTAYRSFPIIGGSPGGSGTLSTSPFHGLSLPTTLGITSGTCTFTGPTMIKLSGSSAQVTSPLTSNPGAACPATLGSGVYTVPVTTTTLYVKNASSSTSLGFLNLPSADITSYSRTAGDAYVSGTLSSGKVSIAAEDDVVVTGNVLASHAAAGDGKQPTTPDPATGEPSWATGSAAVDLVALNDVRVYHPVSCVDNAAADLAATSSAWCPNDATGLYPTTQAGPFVNSGGTLKTTHPSLQYSNLLANSAEPSEIDAAVFALNGSFYADNFDRGTSLGSLLVSGGVYENHHGPLGEQWETPSTSNGRQNSGFTLKINYLNYSNAGLGYVPALSGGNALEPWQVYSVTSGGTS